MGTSYQMAAKVPIARTDACLKYPVVLANPAGMPLAALQRLVIR